MNVRDIARGILAGELPVAGRAVAVRSISRAERPSTAYMMCQHPIDDGPRPRRCLALALPGRGCCPDHPHSCQIVTGG